MKATRPVLRGADGSNVVRLPTQLGSTRALVNQSGSTVGTSTYDPYGNLTSSSGTATTPFGYAGQYTDSESGLQYLRARYYDPQTAQFLTVDPLVGATQQPYSYANDNPLNGVDPTGLCACGDGAGDAGSNPLGGIWTWIQQHAGDIALIAGVAAVTLDLPTEIVIALAVIAFGGSFLAALEYLKNHNYLAAGFDLVGAFAGGRSFELLWDAVRLLKAGATWEKLAAFYGVLGNDVGFVGSFLKASQETRAGNALKERSDWWGWKGNDTGTAGYVLAHAGC